MDRDRLRDEGGVTAGNASAGSTLESSGAIAKGFGDGTLGISTAEPLLLALPTGVATELLRRLDAGNSRDFCCRTVRGDEGSVAFDERLDATGLTLVVIDRTVEPLRGECGRLGRLRPLMLVEDDEE